MQNIEQGDKVRHKTKPLLSQGLSFDVLEIDGDKALCQYNDNDANQTIKEELFDIADLILVSKPVGGFFPGI